MGSTVAAICIDCGHKFEANIGGGMTFELLRCNLCGKTREVAIVDILKKKASEEYYKEFNVVLEKYWGDCKCGGKFKTKAPIRCPKCKSKNIEQGENLCDYD